jgi:hypothetical protein
VICFSERKGNYAKSASGKQAPALQYFSQQTGSNCHIRVEYICSLGFFDKRAEAGRSYRPRDTPFTQELKQSQCSLLFISTIVCGISLIKLQNKLDHEVKKDTPRCTLCHRLSYMLHHLLLSFEVLCDS